MLILIISILSCLLLYLLLKLVRYRNLLKFVAQSLENRSICLLENPRGDSRLMLSLQHAVNDVLDENKNLLQLTREEEAQLNDTLRNIRESVIILDSQNFIISANDAAKNSLGIQGNDEPVRIENYIKSSDFLDFITKVKQGSAVRNQELLVDNLSERRYYEVSASQVQGFGSDDNLLIILHDITRLKNLERMRKDFVANVSHELRTPVTIIKGFSDTLIEDYSEMEESDKERFIRKIHKNVERLNLLLKDLLALSKLDSGSISLNLKDVSLANLVSDAVELSSNRLTDNQRVKIDLDESLDKMHTDPVKVTQVISNLIGNAILHAEGFTELTISSVKKGKFVRIAVRDNGCGIPESDLNRIFERFYRVDKGRSHEKGGTGLGLSIVKHLVHMLGGEVSIESAQGEGTSVSFTIPL